MSIRIRIDGREIEGSPDDIALLINSLGKGDGVSQSDDEAIGLNQSEQMSPDFALDALSRRPLSSSQRRLFKLLTAQPSGWTPSSEIMEAMGFNGNQFGGLFGALGRRVANTKGFKKGYTLFEWQWNEASEEYDCKLHPPVLAALERIKL